MDDAPRTLPEAVRRAADLWPDRTAWVFDLRDGPEAGASTSLTFAEIAQASDRIARRLRAKGIRSGDRVAVLLHNRPEAALAWLALARLGATAVPLLATLLAWGRQGTAALELESGTQSGKKVIEAVGISKTYGDKTLIKNFDMRILRGDRVAFVGPNGVGKTTLLKMLVGEIAPDTGSVSLGTNLEIAVFDQTRAQLDPEASLWENLTGDPLMKVSGASDQVLVRGTPKHVVAYLKDFLFDERQARAPVKALSGGEKARLLLAKLMARSSKAACGRPRTPRRTPPCIGRGARSGCTGSAIPTV